jgi:hypothetical protein
VVQLPDLQVAQVEGCYSQLAFELFGSSGLTSDGKSLKPFVHRFVVSLVVCKWANARKAIDRETKRLEPLKEKVESSWTGEAFSAPIFVCSENHGFSFPALVEMAESGKRPKVQDIRAWTGRVRELTKILIRYADKESLVQLSKQREKLGDMLDALGLNANGQDKKRLCQHCLAPHAHSLIDSRPPEAT